MTRDAIIAAVAKFFDISELVCNHTLKKWGSSAWQFMDTDFLHALLIIRRDLLQLPMYCNNTSQGTFQRGLRCNMCPMVKDKKTVYLSAHLLGKAGDFTIQGMTANEAREQITKNANLLPCPIRLEKDVTWLHMDVLPQTGITQKVYQFKA